MAFKDNYRKISELDINDSVKKRPVLLISVAERAQKNGGSYIDLKMTDGFEKFDAKMFNTDMTFIESQNVSAGDVVDIDITVQSFNNGKSLRIDKILPSQSGGTPADFLVSAPIDVNLAFDKVTGHLKAIADSKQGEYTSITDLAYNLLMKNRDQFIFAGAAKGMHHDIIGGLMYHTYRMFATATLLCQVYKILDSDLLLSAVAIHDLAKIREMNTSASGDITYTVEGQLMGHLYMGAEMVNDYANAHPGKYDPEKVMLLKHMVLSHHLNPEWGAVRGPATAEAQMLHYIDQIDAKMYVYENRFNDLKPGQVTEKVPFGLENYVYKPLE